MSDIELWGGVEATVNRVGDAFRSQLHESGHWHRLEDLERFRDLGIKALRQPVLWELVAPQHLDTRDWSWSDRWLTALRAHRIRPIVGLVHHGSGPHYTSLIDQDFATKLATYARACAERYPWVTDYTPINEPVTTARFSTLYGLWYPHARDDVSFAQAMVNQCKGTVLAMQEIRRVNSRARLIQTDDGGSVSSTPAMQTSAAFENDRRWLAFDLLCGRVNRSHRFWSWLRRGVSEADLQFFLEAPCPPDILGINYYVTSDRTLDERLHRYPREYHGGNAHQRYADVESVRTHHGIAGHEAALMVPWQRFQIPVALTEIHLDCTREEQLRWLRDAWAGAHAARARGADVRAVTAWSLLGAYDWNSLLTRQQRYYEAGAYDVRASEPRPTAVATMARSLAATGQFGHPVLAQEGWWRPLLSRAPTTARAARPLCIIGTNGALSAALTHACERRNIVFRSVSLRASHDLDAQLEQLNPWAIIHTGEAVTSTLSQTGEAPRLVGFNKDVPFVFFSSHRVFSGEKKTPYVESDARAPTTSFGEYLCALEDVITTHSARALIIRTSTLFGTSVRSGFVARAAASLRKNEPVHAADDEVISPSAANDVARATLDLLIDEAWGRWHLVNRGAMSWFELARAVAKALDAPESLVTASSSVEGRGGECTRQFALESERAQVMPLLSEALVRFTESFKRAVEVDPLWVEPLDATHDGAAHEP